MHARGRGWRLRERAAPIAQQHVLVAAPGQSFHEVADLQRAAIEVAAGFDVKNPHARSASVGMAWSTSSTLMSPRQGCLPAQVGERLQGEHGKPW
jgi:hypothetical protein